MFMISHTVRFADLGGKNNYYWGAVGYILHRRGAEKLLSMFAPSVLQAGELVIDFRHILFFFSAHTHCSQFRQTEFVCFFFFFCRDYKPMVSEEMLRRLPFLYHSTKPLIAHGPFLPSHVEFESLIHTLHRDFHQMTNDITLRFFYDRPISMITVFAFLKLLPGQFHASTFEGTS